ncbi:MAG TPA: ROK family protein, partial [Chloroflexi bacterium]|nr:ROK family protein [Chloroflexota bacterium]
MSIIVVDLGGTQIRAARCQPDGRMQTRVTMPTCASQGPEAVLARIQKTIRQVWPAKEKVAALGIAAPGPLDARQGVVLFAPNLPGWKDVPLRDRLVEAFGIPTFVGNDANLAALGEHRFGAGQGVDNLVYLTVSTGIGGGIILNGRLFEGGQGLGGEVGHIIVEPEGPLCSCGSRGCLETLASGPAIARAARDALKAGEPSSLPERVAGDHAKITAREVTEVAREGDALAQNVLARAGFYIGVTLVSLMYLLNPSLFIIGGSVAKAGDLLFEPIRETVRSRAPEIYWRHTPILPAALGDNVGLLGAL